MKLPRKIYAIKHNITNRVYIGSSFHLKERIESHMSRLRNHRHHIEDMQDDFDKYGENYSIEVVDEILCWEDRHKEYEWMEKYSSRIRGVGYNYLDKEGYPQKASELFLTFNGETLTLSEWASRVGIPYNTIYQRICQRKWDVAKALSTPNGKRGRQHEQN